MTAPLHIPQLLAPAGSPAAFWAALAGGADEIYCALGSTFNARRAADNFSEDAFREACRAAHLAGVRVYAAMNIIIREDEMEQALALAAQVWMLGADALIVQDIGFFVELRRRWPEIEIHISTQANVHNKHSVAWCRERGARRVTLSRELSLEEIRSLCAQEAQLDDGCELEVFGHGALCFSYSGICMMSSMRALTQDVRSANRGSCAQPCRLPYDLVDENNRCIADQSNMRPLCPRDLCSISLLEELCKAGIAALKIEGRMKAPDYVYSVVSVYREALDSLAAGHAIDAAQLEKRLKHAFNRDFTDAYLRGTSGNEMMSYERSNNRGLLVGKVVASKALEPQQSQKQGTAGGRPRKKQSRLADTDVALHETVHKGDLLEIRPLDNPGLFLTAPVPRDAQPHETIRVRTARPMAKGCDVRLIRTKAALDAAARVNNQAEAGASVRRRAVHARIVCKLAEPLQIELSCGDVCVVAQGPQLEPARMQAITKEQLIEHVGRMGTTPFVLAGAEVELDEGCGMSMGEVHATRKAACSKLEEALLEPWSSRTLPEGETAPSSGTAFGNALVSGSTAASSNTTASHDVATLHSVLNFAPTPHKEVPTANICVRVANPQAAQVALDAGATTLYADIEALTTYEGWPEDVVPVLPEVCREQDFERIAAWMQPHTTCAVSNLAEIAYGQAHAVHTEVLDGIAVHNMACLEALRQSGVSRLWCSQELILHRIETLAQQLQDEAFSLGVCVYTRQRLMTSEHCVLMAAKRCTAHCASCELRSQKVFLRDERGHCMPVATDIHGRSHIWMSEPIDTIPEVPILLAAGISNFMVDATLLSAQQLQHEVKRLITALGASGDGKHSVVRERGATSGHMYLELV